MSTTITNILSLIKAALTNQSATLSEDVNWTNIYLIASAHRITTLVYYGIKASDIVLPEDIQKKFEESLFKNTLLETEKDYEISKVLKVFEEKHIFYAPLKGYVVRPFYPLAEMRTLGDTDILIKESQLDEISGILTELGYVFDHESSHEHLWKKSTGLYLELHKHFVGKGIIDYFNYYKDSEKFLVPGNTEHSYKMPINDLFVYLIVHIAKHYRTGGIGIRHFIDIYLISHLDTALNEEYVLAELKKLRLDKFYSNIKNMFCCWFDCSEYDDISKLMTLKIFESGIFGNKKNRILADFTKTSRAKKILTDIFLPYVHMAKKYPVLERWPILLPVFWVVRICDVVFRRNRRIGIYRQTIKDVSRESINNYSNELKLVGLE